MSTRKKKKHVCSCGETFNHGIGLRKHQRQTGHKGSRIVEEGDELGAPSPPASPAAPPEPAAAPEAVPEASPPVSAAAISEPDDPDDDRTVIVRATPPSPRPTSVAQDGEPAAVASDPNIRSRLAHQRQKVSLVGRGLKVLLAYRARSAGSQLKRSARSGADIFTEALKLAVALICFLAIPTVGLYWWYSHRNTSAAHEPSPATFSFQDGALAARSGLLTYFDRLAKKNFDQAYGMLSSNWQQEISSRRFRDAFLDIEDLRWAVVDQRLLPDGRAEIETKLAFQEGGRARLFDARFLLVPHGQAWRVDRAEILRELER